MKLSIIPLLILLGLPKSVPCQEQELKTTVSFKFNKTNWKNGEAQTFDLIREDTNKPLKESPIKLAPGDKVKITLIEPRGKSHLVEKWKLQYKWTTERKQGKDTIKTNHSPTLHTPYLVKLGQGIQLRGNWKTLKNDKLIDRERQLTRSGLTIDSPSRGTLDLQGTVAQKTMTVEDFHRPHPKAVAQPPAKPEPQPEHYPSDGQIWFRVVVTITR